MGLVQSIIEIVREEMLRHGLENLRAVHLAVGEMACVVPEQMVFCYQILTENSNLSGSELKMKTVPITYRCRICHREFFSKGIAFHCPSCLGENPQLTAGRELQVEFLEVAD